MLWERNDAVKERAREIAAILAKHGFSFLVKDLGLYRFLSIDTLFATRNIGKALQSEELRRLVHRLPGMFEELGPTFIKLGQFLGSRPDIIPQFVLDELGKLQEEVTPVSFTQIQEMIAREIPDYATIFVSIDPTPLGVASIAQAHIGHLADGRTLVLKVRKPGVINRIELDLAVMQRVVAFLAQQPEVERIIDIENVFAVFSHSIKKETDFAVEAANIELFQNLLAGSSSVRTPRVEWTLTNENILTMEYIEGVSIDQIAQIGDPELRRDFARRFLASFLEQVLLFGVFHGDPHSGNIRLTPQGEIVYLDFGIVGRIDARMTERLIENFIALQHTDIETVMQVAMEMGQPVGKINWQNYYEDIAELTFVSNNMAGTKVEVGKILFGMMHISRRHGIRMSDRMVMLGKAFAVAEGNARKMDPEINFFEVAEPVIKEYIKRNLSPKLDEAAVFANVLDIKKKLRTVFSELPAFISGITKGEKKIPLEITGLDFIGEKLDKSINRVAYSLILASMLLTSSIMMHASGPFEGAIHYTGYYLLLFALGATVYLYFKIFRQVNK